MLTILLITALIEGCLYAVHKAKEQPDVSFHRQRRRAHTALLR